MSSRVYRHNLDIQLLQNRKIQERSYKQMKEIFQYFYIIRPYSLKLK